MALKALELLTAFGDSEQLNALRYYVSCLGWLSLDDSTTPSKDLRLSLLTRFPKNIFNSKSNLKGIMKQPIKRNKDAHN